MQFCHAARLWGDHTTLVHSLKAKLINDFARGLDNVPASVFLLHFLFYFLFFSKVSKALILLINGIICLLTPQIPVRFTADCVHKFACRAQFPGIWNKDLKESPKDNYRGTYIDSLSTQKRQKLKRRIKRCFV